MLITEEKLTITTIVVTLKSLKEIERFSSDSETISGSFPSEAISVMFSLKTYEIVFKDFLLYLYQNQLMPQDNEDNSRKEQNSRM